VRTEGYLKDVMSVYQGEVLGESMFSALLASAETAMQRRQFTAMLQMESEAKARLRPFLQRLGLSTVEDETRRAQGYEVARRYERLSWSEFLTTFDREIREYVDKYQAIADAAPIEDRVPLEFMVEHEKTFLRYVALEAVGRSTEALATLEAQLRYPANGEWGAMASAG
jgi:hypothetical protein